MIMYVFRSMWQRKRTSIFTVLQVFGIFTAFFFSIRETVNVLLPTFQKNGIEIKESVYILEANSYLYEEKTNSNVVELTDLIRQVKGVRAVSFSENSIPFGSLNYPNNGWKVANSVKDQPIEADYFITDHQFHKVFGLELLSGKWFENQYGSILSPKEEQSKPDNVMGRTIKSVERTSIRDVIITRNLADQLNINEAGGKIYRKQDSTWTKYRIKGIVADYKRDEFSKLKPSVFIQREKVFSGMYQFAIELDENAKSEKIVLEAVQNIVLDNKWEISKIAPLTYLRQETAKKRTANIRQMMLLNGFLLAFLTLSLAGMFGYTLKKREAELAIYRAMGASSLKLRTQILAEMMILIAMGVLPALLIIIQIPMLGYYTDITVLGIALLISTSIVVVLAMISVYFPSMKFTRTIPARALQTN